MSLTLRRSLSWVLTLASLASLGIGTTYLPGAGGVLAEFGWLLARDNSSPAQLNRAFSLLHFAEEDSPGARARLVSALVRNSDLRVVRGCLRCIAPQIPTPGALSEDVSRALREWFRETNTTQKTALLPEAFSCWLASTGGTQTVTCGNAAFFTVPPQDAVPALDPDNRRWIVAATAVVHGWERWLVEQVVFPDESADPFAVSPFPVPCPLYELAQRLRYIDGLSTNAVIAKQADIGELPRIATGPLCQLLGIPTGELLSMLFDPIDQVRWGAGRILAVAGDARGLSAFCDWLQHNPRFTANANKLMTDLFGPDWRTHCASGSATSQPGQRDGGG